MLSITEKADEMKSKKSFGASIDIRQSNISIVRANTLKNGAQLGKILIDSDENLLRIRLKFKIRRKNFQS
jgi:hypothetical protein